MVRGLRGIVIDVHIGQALRGEEATKLKQAGYDGRFRHPNGRRLVINRRTDPLIYMGPSPVQRSRQNDSRHGLLCATYTMRDQE